MSNIFLLFINYPVQGQECSLEATHFPGRQKVLSFILRSTEHKIIPSKVHGEAAHTHCNNRSQVSLWQPTFTLGNNTNHLTAGSKGLIQSTVQFRGQAVGENRVGLGRELVRRGSYVA